MNTQGFIVKRIVCILVSILMVTFGTQSISYAQEGNPTITASVQTPLTEATLNGSVVTLTLTDASFERSTSRVRSGVTVSGIHGVTVGTSDVRRVNNTKVTVELTFSGNIDTDTQLVFTVGASSIVDYNGVPLTTQLPVTAVEESLVPTTEAPLTEATLHGSVVTLTLNGRSYTRYSSSIEDVITISGINGVAVYDVDRISNTEANVELTFSGNIDTDAILTLTVGANAIVGYNEGFTFQLPVTAVAESLVATTAAPLTEATLNGSVVTLTLSGRSFVSSEYDIRNALTVSGIEGVAVDQYDVDRVSGTKVTVPLTFSGNIDADATLTLTVEADAIVGYNQTFTVQFPVTAIEESLVATTAAPLTEATLSGSVVTLTLSGRSFVSSEYDIRNALTVSGIEGVTIVSSRYVDRVSATKVTVPLIYSGNIDVDATLTLTVGADAIAGYNQSFSFEFPVTAVEATLVATTEAPLTEATLSGSVVTLTLSGRSFVSSEYDIRNALTVSGIEGVTIVSSRYVDRVSATKVTVPLIYSGNIDVDATLTLTVGADAIAGYNQSFSFEFPVTAVAESLVATTETPLTENTLHGSVVTLTLSGRVFNTSSNVSVSGIEGIGIISRGIRRVSNTEVTVQLAFSGNIDVDATLTLTVGADAIAGYNQSFSFEFPVTAVEESLVATTETPLTENTLHGSVVTLTLTGRSFVSSEYDIRNALTVSGIEGVTIVSSRYVDRVSATKVTVPLIYSGNIDVDAILTLTVGADAIAGYNQSFSFEFPVTAVEATLVATTEAPLTEATLHGSVVTLTLTGRSFASSVYDIRRALTVSGIEGVTIVSGGYIDRVSATMVTVPLIYSGNIDVDAILTLTVGADAIAGYNQSFSFEFPVTAVAESLVATTEVPLTEATLHGSVVTLTLSGRSYDSSRYDIARALSISGIEGVTGSVQRVSNTEATITLGFSGNIDADATLTLTVGADAIAGYNEGFTFQLPVTAVEESLVATTEAPLTEATLSGSVVTLTLSGRSYDSSRYDITRALSISGIEGVTGSVQRVSNTEVTITLGFSGNIDADATLTLTVGADAIAGYNQSFSFEFPVTAVEESLVATTEAPLTEATLSGSIVTLTLNGRSFNDEYDVYNALTVSGIEGASFYNYGVDRVSGTKVTVPMTFSGNIDADATLTLTVGANAIVGYNEGFTFQLPVTAVEESLVATTAAPLTEATLSGSVVTLTLSGRSYDSSRYDIARALSISGIEGVTGSVQRMSNTEVTVVLISTEDFDVDSVLTLTVGADAIAGYNQSFSFEVPVTAVEESMTATTETPLSEATLTGSVVTLNLSGRNFTDEWDIADALTFSGIEGIFVPRDGVERVSNTEAKITLFFSGNIDIDGTFTLTVGADAITSYNKGFSFEFPVTAVEESLVVSTQTPLTEATLYGNSVILTLNGRNFIWWRKNVQDAVTVSGIEGVTVGNEGIYTDDDSQVAVPLLFSGDIHEDATLTLTVEAGAIAGYDEVFTTTFSVPAVEESLDISSKFDLTEATLSRSQVILTLNGRSYMRSSFDIRDEVSVTGIEGVTVRQHDVDRVSNNQVAVVLSFDGTDFDMDSTLTFTVGADVIAGYGEALTAQIPVTAIKQSSATISISPNPIVSPPLSEQLTFSLNIRGGKDVAGFQAVVWYDNDTLKYMGSTKGNYLPADTFFVAPTVQEYEYYRYPNVPIAATALDGVRNGNGTLATVTFEVYNDVKESEIVLTNVYIVDREGVRWEVEIEGAEVTEPPHDIVGDINRDGIVNIRDLVLAGNRFGLSGENRADINEDGIVDIADLVLVANAFGADAAAPSLNPQIFEQLTAADVKDWLTQAQQLSLTDPAYLRGITVLEDLHRTLTPKKTALLRNFPNPFNPETWIPYHLSKDADVTLHIYAVNGTLARTLTLGHQPAGMYQNRSRAAYWDGKNEFGEKVASGVYFYTLTAGEFTATRKLLIRK